MDPRRLASLRREAQTVAASDLELDQLEHEDGTSRMPGCSEILAGAPHPSFVPDSHFGPLSTAETLGNYYGKNGRPHYDAKLPITAYREEIMSTIESNSVVVIQGSTGSGKTTQVPQYILDR